MRSFLEINPLRTYLASVKSGRQSVGLVPTMGALHDGHDALVKKSLAENDCTVVSVFVNKAQFNNAADYDSYPLQKDEDTQRLANLKCDVVFAPSDEVMYPGDSCLSFHFGELERTMEGHFRPGHFSGVGLIVSKLFNIVMPDRAYFGQKDLQQCAIIRQLAYDLNFPIDIRIVPTVRDDNGLALSSRNLRLTQTERVVASDLYKSLVNARTMLLAGQPVAETKSNLVGWFDRHAQLNLEYVEIVNSHNLQPIDQISSADQVSLCVAAYIREVRLIDNIYLFE